DSDRAAIKAQIVDVMLTSPRAILLQMSDTVAIIANADFPHAWETLVPELVSKLAMDDMARNLGILETAATIFGRWRGMTRSNALFTEIKLVLDQWCPSYLELFRVIDAGIDQHATQWAQLEPRLAALDLMFKIYYSLNCQDLPEFFEDHLAEFCGFFGKYLQYQNPVVEQAADPATPGVLERIQETICEIVHMYGTRYESDFPQLPEFVRLIWNLLTTRSLDPRFDVLTSKAMGFLAGVARPPRHRALFEAPETLQSILEKIAIPNMQLREADQELFEDDPLQYVRRDLEGNDTETRRRAAADLVRALLEHFCEPISAMAIQYYNTFLAHYAQDKAQFWLHKNTALYLIVSVSAKNIVNSRVVDLNPKIQIGEIFAQSILPELQEAAGAMAV
ncbi:Exportin, Cse1-like protein, partial [Caulochytrium protostelioides]